MIPKHLYPIWIAVLAAVLTFGTAIHFSINDALKIALVNGVVVGLFYLWSIRFAHLRNRISYLLLTIVLILVSVSHFPLLTIFIYAMSGIMGLLYHYGIPGRVEPFRRIPFLKNAIIAINWTLITFLIPFSFTMPIDESIFYWGSFERAFLIFAITIPFDIADKHTDTHTDLTTLIHLFGEQKSIFIAKWCIVFSMGIYLFMNDLSSLSDIAVEVFYLIEIVLLWSYSTIIRKQLTNLVYEGSLFVLGVLLGLTAIA